MIVWEKDVDIHTDHQCLRQQPRQTDKQASKSTSDVHNLYILEQLSRSDQVRLRRVGVHESREMRCPVRMRRAEGTIQRRKV